MACRGFDPTPGNAFEIVTATAGITGLFGSVTLPVLDPGEMWQVRYNPESVSLLVTVAGDYNNDGNVDAADYVLWRKTGINGQDGYNTWRANFGLTPGSGSSLIAGLPPTSTVPEPTSAVLFLSFAIVGAGRPRRG